MRNRDSHVRRTELGDHRAVAKFDEAMNDGLWMDENVEFVRPQCKQVMGLDEFETLVHQRRRIDCYLGAHGPGRMLQGLLHRDFADRVQRPSPERTAGCSEHDAPNVLTPAGAQRLENRIVLGVDWQNRGAFGGGTPHEQRACANQALFIRERDRDAALCGCKRWRQTCRASDCRHDPIRRPLRGLDNRRLAGGSFDA